VPQPRKTLRQLVQDGTFEARRQTHRELLDGPDVPWPALAALQERYRQADGNFMQRAIAREFERAVAEAHEQAAQQAEDLAPPLEEELAKLGPPHSAQRAKRFFPRFLTLEDDSTFRLQRWQGSFIDEAWKRHPSEDRRLYKEILLGVPRGNGKTPLAAGLGTLTLLESPPIPEVFQAAGSKEQARTGIDFATRWAGDDTELATWLRAKSNALQLLGRRGFFRIVSADGRQAHSYRPSAAFVDEWWLYQAAREEQVYIAFATSIDKKLEAFLLATTTGGFDRNSQLGKAYEKAMHLPDIEHRRHGFLRIARDLENGRLTWWYGMPDGYELDLDNDRAVLRALKLANPSSFVDHQALLRALRRATDPYEWMRLHLNAWTEGREAWLPLGCFNSLRAAEPIPAGAEIYVAVDAALKHDTTAVVWAALMPNGQIRLMGRAWAARDTAPAHERMPGGRIDNRQVMEWIDMELGSRYQIKEIVADPRFFDDYLYELGQRGYLVAEFAQNSRAMRDAEQHFYQAATAGTFDWHDPTGIMALHVNATSAIATKYGYKVDNPEKRKPIDLATAAIMVRERCTIAGRVPDPVLPMIGFA
jgi:phage terminase large subunit-like protein